MAETVQERQQRAGNSLPVDVIGAGRIGGALHAAALDRGVAGALITRAAGWEVLASGPVGRPILVATRNDDLPGVVDRIPAARRDDLVFVQNGMIRPLLADLGLADASRGVLFLAVPQRGAAIEVGEPSPFTGPRAGAVVAWLRALDVAAVEVDRPTFAGAELEKLVWNSVFGLLSQATGATVGEVCDRHEDALREVVGELVAVAKPTFGVDVDLDVLLGRLCAYSRSIAGWKGKVGEWPSRNGWFVAEARRRGVPTPAHDAWLARAGLPT